MTRSQINIASMLKSKGRKVSVIDETDSPLGILRRLVNHYDALQESNGASVNMAATGEFTAGHWIGRMAGDIEKAKKLLE